MMKRGFEVWWMTWQALSGPTMAQTECLVQREPRAWQEDVCSWRGEDRNAMLEGLRAPDGDEHVVARERRTGVDRMRCCDGCAARG